ncbi:MAG: hypothetical protein WC466_08050 [Candidatus Izemoplasmatales bacterium]
MIENVIKYINSEIAVVEKNIELRALQYEPAKESWGDIYSSDFDEYPIFKFCQEDLNNHIYYIGRYKTLCELKLQISIEISLLHEKNRF